MSMDIFCFQSDEMNIHQLLLLLLLLLGPCVAGVTWRGAARDGFIGQVHRCNVIARLFSYILAAGRRTRVEALKLVPACPFFSFLLDSLLLFYSFLVSQFRSLFSCCLCVCVCVSLDARHQQSPNVGIKYAHARTRSIHPAIREYIEYTIYE